MSTGSRPHSTRLGVVAALLLLAGIAVSSLVWMNRFADGAQWVSHTHEVIEALDAVRSRITDAESAQRGFLLTGDESNLSFYSASKAALASRLVAVKKLCADNVSQFRRID